MDDFKWSAAEKKIAKRAFDAALKRESEAVIAKLKGLAKNAENPEDIWVIHDYLAGQRKIMDGKYDYRYSQLIVVFGRLLRERWLKDGDLDGLSEQKLQTIRHIASL